MPERTDQQIAEDGSVLSLWLRSQEFKAFERLLEDALDDRRAAVLNAPVKSQEDFYSVLEAKGRYLGLMDVMQMIRTRISAGVKARDRLRGNT